MQVSIRVHGENAHFFEGTAEEPCVHSGTLTEILFVEAYSDQLTVTVDRKPTCIGQDGMGDFYLLAEPIEMYSDPLYFEQVWPVPVEAEAVTQEAQQ